MKKLLIFAGTTEGRRLGELFKAKYETTLSVATEYGGELAGENAHCERMNEEQMTKFICENSFDFVVDATHPYAKNVSENVKKSCERANVRFMRLLREKSDTKGCILTDSAENCVRILEKMNGNVMLTTGSKELDVYTKTDNYKERFFVRVLPTPDSVQRAAELGYKPSHIIAMQGPFSHELNVALFKQLNIAILVTKDGGMAGGFAEKISAANEAGVRVILLSRPCEEGLTMENVVAILEENV